MPISKETAMDIALAHREFETGKQLLDDIVAAVSRHQTPDIRDVFGRPTGGLQLGIPSGKDVHRLFDVSWSLARPVIEAHIAQVQARLLALNEKAAAELAGPEVAS